MAVKNLNPVFTKKIKSSIAGQFIKNLRYCKAVPCSPESKVTKQEASNKNDKKCLFNSPVTRNILRYTKQEHYCLLLIVGWWRDVFVGQRNLRNLSPHA